MSNSLRPHEQQHAKPPCPSPTPGVHSDLHPSSQWCHISMLKICCFIYNLLNCHSLLLLPPIPPSIRVFSNESTLRMRGPKYWSYSVSIIPSKEIPGLTSFRMDLLDLLAVQGTLKSLLQYHSSKVSILRRSSDLYLEWVWLISLTSFDLWFDIKWVHSSHPVAKVLEFQLQHQSFQWIFRTDLL